MSERIEARVQEALIHQQIEHAKRLKKAFRVVRFLINIYIIWRTFVFFNHAIGKESVSSDTFLLGVVTAAAALAYIVLREIGDNIIVYTLSGKRKPFRYYIDGISFIQKEKTEKKKPESEREPETLNTASATI